MLQKDVKYWYRRALVEMRTVCVLTAYDGPEYVGVDVVVADTGVLHGTFAGLQDLRECASKLYPLYTSAIMRGALVTSE